MTFENRIRTISKDKLENMERNLSLLKRPTPVQQKALKLIQEQLKASK